MKKVLKNGLFYVIIIAVIIVAVVMILQTTGSKSTQLSNYSDVVRLLDDPDAFILQLEASKASKNTKKITNEASTEVATEVATEASTEAITEATEESTSAAKDARYVISSILVGNDNVLTITVKDTLAVREADSKITYVYKMRSADVFYNDFGQELLTLIREDGSELVVEYEPANQNSAWLVYLPYVLVIVAFIVIYIIAIRKTKNMDDGGFRMGGFGKAKVKTPQADKDKVTFNDVAGADEEKQELEEVVDFLKDPSKYTRLGARIPRGILLVGSPGTGKTLLAKAVAGEAGVPFFSISGSDFVEMYVGVGASRVRDLFDTARKAPASIIFIDEIDAVGRHRGAGLGGGHDEREQTLNQLLVEMDGFGTHDGVIVMAATNRPDILDPALLRPGRFDRQVTVRVPDITGREAILRVHSRKKPLEPGVDLREVAKSTAGFSGADLANLLNEAALLAARRGKNLIGMDDISDAFIKVIAGPKKRSMHIKDEDKRKTAYHEAGHAMIAYLLGLDPVQQISIIPSGNALGYTLNPPADDKYSEYKNEMKAQISMLLAGRAAEAIVCGDISGGASNDIQRATKIAKRMVTQLGMSDVLGPRCFGNGQEEIFLGREISSSPDYSDETASKIDAEIHTIIDTAYKKAIELLTDNRSKLDFLAECLVKFEMIDGDQFRAVMEQDDITVDDVQKIADDKKARSKEANEKIAAEKQAAQELAKQNNNSSDFFADNDKTEIDYETGKDEKDNEQDKQ